MTIPSRILRSELPALVWAHPDANGDSPLLVAHDGPEYAEHSSLLRLLPQLPPLRATLIGPVDRNEIYSASAPATRARSPRRSCPSLPPAPVRIGLGASLGALALFHAHRRFPQSFDALYLQSGSFFRRAESYERWFPRYERIARFVGGVHRNRPERPIPRRARLRHGRGEPRREPRPRRLARRPRYDVRLHEFRDGHNWVAWRDSFQPAPARVAREDLA